MNIRPKTRRRLLILLAIIAIITGTCAYLISIGNRHKAAALAQLRREAMASYQAGEYDKAVDQLGRYLDQSKTQDSDAEALFAYGKSRIAVPMERGMHVQEGINVFERYTRLRPRDAEAQHLLLKLYTGAAYNVEAVRLADDLLSRDPKDIEALREKTLALNNQRHYDQALAASRQFNVASPLDIRGQITTLYLMQAAHKPSEELLAYAKSLREAHPGDPRFDVVTAHAYILAGQDAEAGKWIASAAAAAPPDSEYVSQVALLLDKTNKFDDAASFIEKAATASNDAKVLRVWIERLWEKGRFAEVFDRLKNLDVAGSGSDSSLLAYRALAGFETGHADDAAKVLAALQRRVGDNSAAAWSMALTACYVKPVLEGLPRINRLQQALTRDAHNPVIRSLLGQSYASMGETERAMDQWRQAIREASSWPAPFVSIAQMLISTGRSAEAVEYAQEAVRRSNDYSTATTLAVAWAARAQEIDPESADYPRLIQHLKEIQTRIPNEPRTLPAYVSALARTKQRDEAAKVISDALAANPPVATETLLKLAAISDAEKLDLGDKIRQQVKQGRGMTPDVALAEATALAHQNKSAEGLARLLEAEKGHESELPWRVAEAQYRESINDPAALAEWTAIADQNPTNLAVQELVLRAPSRQRDRAMWLRTIDRVKTLTGEQGLLWKIERAQWLLNGELSERDKGEAINLLTDVTRTAPTLAEPHRLLADALLKVNNVSRAISELTAAADARPGDVATTSQLISLLIKEQRTSEAIAYLDKLSKGPSQGANVRLWIARTYGELGQTDKAIALLTAEKSTGPLANQRNWMLAELYRQKGRDDETERLYRSLLDSGIADASFYSTAADFFASRNDLTTAQTFLVKMPATQLKPGGVEVRRAQFAERWLDVQAAEKQYKAATAAASSEGTWGSLAGFYLRNRRFDDAAAAAAQGLTVAPGNVALLALANDARTLKSISAGEELQPLLDVLSRRPQDVGPTQMLAALADARAKKSAPAEGMERLAAIAEKAIDPSRPDLIGVLSMVIEAEVTAGRQNRAIELARHTADAYPTEAEPQRLLAMLYARANEWTKALQAAQVWRQRAPGAAVEADLMLAGIYLQQPKKDPNAALAALKPHVGESLAAAQRGAVQRTYARALIGVGREAEAADLLKPVLAEGAGWRMAWLELAAAPGHKDAAAAMAWIDQVVPLIPPQDVTERTALADAYAKVGSAFGSQKALEAARDVLQPLAQRPDTTPRFWMTYAMTVQSLGDLDAAEVAYRKVLTADAGNFNAANDLAYALWLRGRDADMPEARKLAEQATTARPDTASFHDTLARVRARLGDRKGAIESFRMALKKDPSSIEAMIGLADVLAHDPSQRGAARDLIGQAQKLIESSPPLSPPLRKQFQTVRDAVVSSM